MPSSLHLSANVLFGASSGRPPGSPHPRARLPGLRVPKHGTPSRNPHPPTHVVVFHLTPDCPLCSFTPLVLSYPHTTCPTPPCRPHRKHKKAGTRAPPWLSSSYGGCSLPSPCVWSGRTSTALWGGRCLRRSSVRRSALKNIPHQVNYSKTIREYPAWMMMRKTLVTKVATKCTSMCP